ncbi:I78 family peptidase inhibitor [Sphingomonas sp. HITSZ_GF]|uniref:I78 family peptidase inhibitor n=1 Tax=Sphingomonas sp. HITSZ_GF TaxID=3037247 RepID=UPI00240DC577|nr:I78 family peptidase inhibitor [Sphingomonas sp. HITSZ_GF]MDG2532929.1 I78 family peptidase inhibitor [Sphingomonas sp. HITSZ_GF]
MIRIALPVAALLLVGACAPKTPAAAIPGVECSAEKLGELVGKARSPEVEAEARRLSGANVVRWLTPGMMVTMEFRADRLNLHLGTDGKIGSARCG